MQNLREEFQKNKERLNDKLPNEGHIERFEKRLEQFNQSNRQGTNKKRYFFAVSIAASLALIIGIGTFIFDNDSTQFAEQNVAEQFTLTNNFYKEEMNSQIAEIECKLTNVDEDIKDQVINDLKNVIKESQFFVESIESDENSELAMKYLVKHYRTNIEALKQINSKLGNHVEC